MTPPRAPQPRHIRYSVRYQARLDAETAARLEALAARFHRTRAQVLRHVMQCRCTRRPPPMGSAWPRGSGTRCGRC
jgi:hypothetical protein